MYLCYFNFNFLINIFYNIKFKFANGILLNKICITSFYFSQSSDDIYYL